MYKFKQIPNENISHVPFTSEDLKQTEKKQTLQVNACKA